MTRPDEIQAAVLAERQRCYNLVMNFPMRKELGRMPYWNMAGKSMALSIASAIIEAEGLRELRASGKIVEADVFK